MRVLVAGASGAIGLPLVRTLRAADHADAVIAELTALKNCHASGQP